MALPGQGHNWDNRYSWSLPVSSWAAWRRGEERPCGCGQGSEGAEGEARLLVKEALGCFLLVASPGRTRWGWVPRSFRDFTFAEAAFTPLKRAGL